MPDYLESYYDLSSTKAVLFLGVMTVITGLVGTYSGSALMNKRMKGHINDHSEQKITQTKLENYRTENACILIVRLIAVAFFAAAGSSFIGIFYVFYILFGITEMFMFLCISPVAICVMSCVPPHLRGLSNGTSSLIMNLLGPATAPVVVGWMIDTFGMYWGMVFNSLWLSWAFLAWMLAWNSAVIEN